LKIKKHIKLVTVKFNHNIITSSSAFKVNKGMARCLRLFVVLLLIAGAVDSVNAQILPPPPPPPPPSGSSSNSAPIDGGVVAFVVAAGAYGAKKYRDKQRKNEAQ